MSLVTTDYTILEILDKVSNVKTHGEKVHILTKFRNHTMKNFFEMAFDPNITFSFKPPKHVAKDTYPDATPFSLKAVLNKARMLSDQGQLADVPEEKKIKIASNMLDGMCKKEADILVLIFKKQFKYKGIDVRIIKKVYEGLINFDET